MGLENAPTQNNVTENVPSSSLSESLGSYLVAVISSKPGFLG